MAEKMAEKKSEEKVELKYNEKIRSLIETLFKNGMSVDDISKNLEMDVSVVEELMK